MTKIRIQLFVVSHPFDLIYRFRIFGVACPSDFFAQIKRVEIAVVVCHNQESAQSGIRTIWISLLQMKSYRNELNHFNFMDSYPDGLIYTFLAVLIQILATLPVTTATNKRSFSALKYLKACLRNTTKEVRLNGLALLYVHRDISLDFEQIIAEFSRKNQRRNFNQFLKIFLEILF